VRRAVIALLLLAAFVATSATAFGHAVPVASTPEPGAVMDASPAQVTVTFNEPVQLLRPEDFDVVDATGVSVASTPGAVTATDRRVIEIGLRPDLPDGTYTARYQVIGADSHVVPNLLVFGVGVDEVGPPYLGGASGGPSATGPWSVSARYAAMITLGGLLGLIAFRWLVWGIAWRRPPEMPAGERETLLTWSRDDYWMLFGVLAVAAMVAQGYALVVQSASALGIGVWAAARDPSGISDVLSQTDFGSQVQVRGALLFVLFAVGAVQFMREYGSGRDRAPAAPTAGRAPSLVMAALVLSVLGSIAAQGHARVTDWPWLQIGAQLVHTAGAAVWITGLALVIVVWARAPALAPQGGAGVAARLLSAFSLVATAAIIVIIGTGVIRSIGELGGVAELWDTAYGRSILFKIGLLVPLTGVALYNRRILAALGRVGRPNGATLRLVRRTVGCELGLSLVIVLIAAILVAQVPGG